MWPGNGSRGPAEIVELLTEVLEATALSKLKDLSFGVGFRRDVLGAVEGGGRFLASLDLRGIVLVSEQRMVGVP